MVWIEAKTEASVNVRATKAKAWELIKNVEKMGVLFPGVNRVESRGDGKFRFLLAERVTLGVRFVGDYVNLYQEKGDNFEFHTLEGNMKVHGRWSVQGPDGNIVVREAMTTELDAPVPRILKSPAQLFAEHELVGGVKKQLDAVKHALERG